MEIRTHSKARPSPAGFMVRVDASISQRSCTDPSVVLSTTSRLKSFTPTFRSWVTPLRSAQRALRFSKLSISLDGLEDWRRSDVIVVNEETKDGAHRSRNVAYTETPIKYPLKDGALSLRSIVHCTAVEGIPYRELSMRQYDFLDYHRKRATSRSSCENRRQMEHSALGFAFEEAGLSRALFRTPTLDRWDLATDAHNYVAPIGARRPPVTSCVCGGSPKSGV